MVKGAEKRKTRKSKDTKESVPSPVWFGIVRESPEPRANEMMAVRDKFNKCSGKIWIKSFFATAHSAVAAAANWSD